MDQSSFPIPPPCARVAAVLTVFNQPRLAARCVRAALEQRRPPEHVCVVLNGASADIVEAFQTEFGTRQGVELIWQSDNLGNPAGVRIGVRAALRAGADWVWILEDDALPTPDALGQLLDADRHRSGQPSRLRSPAVFCSLVVDPSTGEMAFPCAVLDRVGRQRLARTRAELPTGVSVFPVRGAWLGALIPRVVLERVGEVNAALFIRGEDEEYPARIRQAGFEFFCVRDSVVEHPGQRLLGLRLLGNHFFYEPGLPLWKAYYLVRNHTYVRWRYAGGPVARACKALGTILLAAIFAVRHDEHKVRRVLLYLRAGWDGILGRLERGPRPPGPSSEQSTPSPDAGPLRHDHFSDASAASLNVVIVPAMRGEFASMDVYSDGLCAGLRAVRPRWHIQEMPPATLLNQGVRSPWQQVLVGLRRYRERFWSLPRRVARQRADIVHVLSDHHFHLTAFMPPGTRTVATCHDLICFQVPENIRPYARFLAVSRLAQRVSLMGLRRFMRITTPATSVSSEIETLLHIPRDRMATVPNAVHPSLCPPTPVEREAARTRAGVPPGSFCVLHVGTVEVRKNVDGVLETVRRLAASGVPVFFLKAGKELTETQWSWVRAHGLEERVRSLGRVPEMRDLYLPADVLLFPSFYEGYGFPVIEAMACGVPVVTSDLASMPEAAGGAALLVDPRDPEAMTAAVERVYRDPACRKDLIARGLERVRPLRWEEVARQVAAIYEGCGPATALGKR